MDPFYFLNLTFDERDEDIIQDYLSEYPDGSWTLEPNFDFEFEGEKFKKIKYNNTTKIFYFFFDHKLDPKEYKLTLELF